MNAIVPCPPPQPWPPSQFPPSWWSGNQCCPPVQSPVPCPPLSPPSCFSAIAKAQSCWDQSQDLTALLTQVLTDILNSPAGQTLLTDQIETILKTTPGIIPGSGLGVTDGSPAAPGTVGETLTFLTDFTFAGYPTNTVTSASMGVIPAGDWDIWAWASFDVAIGGAQFYLNPQPPGMASNLGGFNLGLALAPSLVNILLLGTQSTALFASPQLFNFTVDVWQQTDSVLTAGTGAIEMVARRRR